MAVAEYVEVFYNRQRPHASHDYRTPALAWTDHEGNAVTGINRAIAWVARRTEADADI